MSKMIMIQGRRDYLQGSGMCLKDMVSCTMLLIFFFFSFVQYATDVLVDVTRNCILLQTRHTVRFSSKYRVNSV